MQQSNLIRAIRFAHRKHTEVGQRRKWSNQPYITHPIAVVRLLMQYAEPTEAMLVAAALHDTVEDTNTTLEEIENNFGREVAELVYWLTDVAKPEDGNRATRMKINRDHIEAAPAEAQTIKAADSTHNLMRCVELAGGFAFKYIPEKRAAFEILHKADPLMMQVFDRVLTEQESQLKEKKLHHDRKRTDQKATADAK